MTIDSNAQRPGGPASGRRSRRSGLWLVLAVVVLFAAGGSAILALTGRSLAVPGWAVAQIEGRINGGLAGQGAVSLGGADLLVDAEWVPRVRLRDVALRNRAGRTVLTLPDLRVSLAKGPLLRGVILPRTLRVSGASLALRRLASGEIGLDFDAGRAGAALSWLGLGDLDSASEPDPGPLNLADVLDGIDRAFASPALAGIERVEADGLTFTLDDARAGRVWQVTEGRMRLTQTATEVSIAVEAELPAAGKAAETSQAAPGRASPTRTPGAVDAAYVPAAPGDGTALAAELPTAGLSLSFTSQKGSRQAQVGATLRNVPSGDIATQAAALAWLAPLDAPISGAFRAEIDGSGQIGMLNGTLEIGAGRLRPGNVAQPIEIRRGKVYFAYDPVAARITFTDVTVDSRALRIKGRGHAYLTDIKARLPQTLLGQVQFADVAVDPEGLFAAPVRFSEGALDLRLRLDPFELTIGQMVLIEDGRRIAAKGRIGADAQGWDVALDLVLDAVAHDRLLALWPVGVVPRTREWLAANVQTGLLFDVKAALRLKPDAEPRLSLGYEFTDTDVRFLKTLPPITRSTGYATINDDRFVVVVDKGVVTPPLGGEIDVSGTVFTVPDIGIKPAPASIALRTDSTITAAMSLLDEPPFGFLTKAGQPVDVAEGRAVLRADIGLPLADAVVLEDVSYRVAGRLEAVRSDRLVPGRALVAEALELRADAAGMTISGAGTLDGVAFDASWSQDFGTASAGRSRLDATLALSQGLADAFGIGLPPGALQGTGEGQLTVDLAKGQAPAFRLVSDLNRLGLRIPEMGWSKPSGATGRFEVAGTLGTPPLIERLEIDAPGLRAAGRVTLNGDGTLEAARFSRVQAGNWLDGPVVLTGQGRGRPVAVAVTGGQIDVRRTSFGTGGGTGGGPVSLSLDRLIISEGISLNSFRGSFNGRGGFNGRFTAAVNGGPQVAGTVAPSAKGGRSAVRLRAEDAGAVFRAAGIFEKGRRGDMDLILIPTAEAGNYNGRLTVRDIGVRQAPALADLLGAISVIGLLEQLNGEGILFSDVEADFRLTPQAVEVVRGSAVGTSLGVSMAGLYVLGSKRMDMQGVISPIYLLNGIGSVLTRKGEGLFGFSYRVVGTSDAPRVQVNPLSILTPGMFRELFRRPPPSVSQ